MEKYLVIIIIIIILYYIFKYCIQMEVDYLIKNIPASTKQELINKNIENFGDITTNSNIDDNNSINLLSKIAKDLQTPPGGLRILGNLTVNGSFNLLPRGIITAWNSTIIPSGWALCDGLNGTPDLRGKFILSTGQATGMTNRTLNDTGGVETVALTMEQIPSHTHKFKSLNQVFVNSGRDLATTTTSNTVEFRDVQTEPSTGTTATTTGEPHDNMPPFFVLTYIMKT